jgi:glycosyltransferase involved in cell wall biosynthesis
VRLVAFTDYVYREVDGVVYGERAFAVFLSALAEHVEELTILGRLDPGQGACHYPLPAAVRFVKLPHYASLSRPIAVVESLVRSLGRFWRVLDGADRVWLLGPYPHAVAFALLTRIRRRALVLGVRQDFPTYVRSRRPGQRWMHAGADVLERSWRWLARSSPVIVVGPELARQYRMAPALLEIVVSLVRDSDIEQGTRASGRSYEGELHVLSVGRLDTEKNPLLLAQVLCALREADPRWRLVVCGEGPLSGQLAGELERLGLSDSADLRGYVPVQGGLLDLYRASHAFLHVSLTEGMPQVLIEAFASGLPVVATAVGGVPDAAGDAAILIPPADAGAAVSALLAIAGDRDRRGRLIAEGLARARAQTLDVEVARVSEFIARPGREPSVAGQPRSSGG